VIFFCLVNTVILFCLFLAIQTDLRGERAASCIVKLCAVIAFYAARLVTYRLACDAVNRSTRRRLAAAAASHCALLLSYFLSTSTERCRQVWRQLNRQHQQQNGCSAIKLATADNICQKLSRSILHCLLGTNSQLVKRQNARHTRDNLSARLDIWRTFCTFCFDQKLSLFDSRAVNR